MESNSYIRIKELEERSGIPRSTIHYYLREGLLHPPTRTSRTMAYYDESHLQCLEQIRKLKMDMRMPIDFIRRQIQGVEGAEPTTARRKEVPSRKDPYADKLKDLRRQEITRAGIKVFSAKGYHQTRVQDITDELDISTGTFYLYFKNKRELFVEVVDDVIRHILGNAAEAIRNETDFKRRIELRAKVFYDNYLRYNEILSQLRAEMTKEDDWALQKVKNIYHQLTEPIIRESRQAIKLGLIRPIDPDLLAYALTGLIEVMTLRSTVDDKYGYEELYGFIESLVREGILPDKS